ncbi:MAG: hypothetical protein QF541_02565 [Lentisphaeria bacterium]|nr:hypothetical protein [Lentisphaeria bacterium]
MFALAWHLILAACSLLLARRFRPETTWPRLVLDALILFYAIMVATVTVLGALSILWPGVITVVLLAVLLATVACTRPDRMLWPRLPTLPPAPAILCAAVVCVYAVTLYLQSFLPPLNSDALLYHLPFARHLYEQQNLSLPLLFFTDLGMTYYPKAGVMPYFMLMHGEREYLLKFAQLPFVLIGALSVYLLMRHVEWRREIAVAGAASFCLLGPVMAQASLCFVDLMMASTFMAALYYFYTLERRDTLLGLLAGGLLIGTKSFALLFLFVVLPLLLPRLRDKLRGPWIWCGGAFLMVIAGYNYWQNLFLTGNPVYPGQVSIAGFTVFPGLYEYARESIVAAFAGLMRHNLGWADASVPALAVLLPFPVLVSVACACRESKLLLYVIAAPWVAIFLYAILVPPYYHGEQVRHLLPAYAASLIGLMYLLQRLRRFGWAVYIVPLILLVPRLENRSVLMGTVIMLAVVSGVYWVCCKFARAIYGIIIPVAGALLFLIVWQIPLLDQVYLENRNLFFRKVYGDRGDIWAFVDKNSGAGKTIAHVGLFYNYTLRGGHLQNTVVYQSVNSPEVLPVHEYPRRTIPVPWTLPQIEGVYRSNPSVDTWLRGLISGKVDWVVVNNASEAIEKRWIRDRPGQFRLIYENSYGAVYALSLAPDQAGGHSGETPATESVHAAAAPGPVGRRITRRSSSNPLSQSGGGFAMLPAQLIQSRSPTGNVPAVHEMIKGQGK